MGAIPPRPPPMRMSGDELHKEFMDDLYRDRNRGRPSEGFGIALLVLAPWILSVAWKLWSGDWLPW